MSWPADAARLQAGRAFLRDQTHGRTVLVPDTDVDGLTAALVVARALERLGRPWPEVVLPGRGEHVHQRALAARIAEVHPDALIVVDQGSRAGTIVAGVPTLVLDHHVPRGEPEGALLVSAADHPPVANTSRLAWELVRPLVEPWDGADDLRWVALLGTVGDLGTKAPLPGVAEALAEAGAGAVREAVVRLNAPARAPGHRVGLAWEALVAARSPADIARGRVPQADALQALRAEVAAEVRRCARTAPLLAGSLALLLVRSEAKVHPLIARQWVGRLRQQVVIAANAGWRPERVNFAMRTALDLDLLALLAPHRDLGDEVGHGHPRATGGSLPEAAFFTLLDRLGFDRDRVAARLHAAEREAA
jgi:single-stranded-DNA-specific exonuclease